MILLFLPSFRPEEAIGVRFLPNGVASIDYMVATVALAEVQRKSPGGSLNHERLAGLMNVTHTSVSVPGKTFRAWFRDFWLAIDRSSPLLASRAFENLFQLDGTQYRLDYDAMASNDTLSLRLMGSELGENDRADLPLIRWMNRVRTEVSKLARQPGR